MASRIDGEGGKHPPSGDGSFGQLAPVGCAGNYVRNHWQKR
jgi:hypothetical protein